MNREIRILIVEDESIIAEELRRMLVKFGYQVVGIAHRYQEAIAMIENHLPDLILLDIGLNYSENDGIELASHINKAHKIPFIYITANADISTVNRAKITEPAAYITKPFNDSTIYSNIEIVLHRVLHEKYQGTIMVKQGTKKVMLSCQKIVYLKADNMYTEVHTADNKTYIVREFLKSFLIRLDKPFIVQIHRSYAVNINFMQSYNHDYIFLPNTKLPISHLYGKNLELSKFPEKSHGLLNQK